VKPVKQRFLVAAVNHGVGIVNRPMFKTSLKYGLGITLLAFVVWTNWAGLKEAAKNPIHVGPIVLATTFCLAALLLTFVRWYVLVRAQDLPFTLFNAFRLGLIGYFLNTFLPGSVGGDIIKAAFLAREQSRRTVAVATVLIDRFIGLWGLCWLVTLLGTVFWAAGFLTGTAETTLHIILLAAAGTVAASIIGWVGLGRLPAWRAARFAGRLEGIPKAGHSLAEFWRAVWIYRLQGKGVWLALCFSVVGHVGFVFTFYFAALSLHENPTDIPSIAQHFLIIPIGMTIQAVFPTPGGLGAGEFSFGALYYLIGYPKEFGVLGSLVQRVISWVLGLTGYIIYLRMRPALRIGQAQTGEPSPNGQLIQATPKQEEMARG
jgi:uncharacterized protein (TIRG00374 family)